MKSISLAAVLVSASALAGAAVADASTNASTNASTGAAADTSFRPVSTQSLQVRERIRSIEQINVTAEKEVAPEAPSSERVKALLQEATQLETAANQSAEQ